MFRSVLPADEVKIVHRDTSFKTRHQFVVQFQQTLKSLLLAYYVQMNVDWEDGLPWLLLAAREVTEDTSEFRPKKLGFGHTVRGPLALLQTDSSEAGPPYNLINYVNGFRLHFWQQQR